MNLNGTVLTVIAIGQRPAQMNAFERVEFAVFVDVKQFIERKI